jgi:hypothetical protein
MKSGPLNLAINACTNCHRHRLAGGAKPGRNNRAESAGRTASGNNEQSVWRRQRSVYALRFLANDRSFPAIRPLVTKNACVLEYVLSNIGF